MRKTMPADDLSVKNVRHFLARNRIAHPLDGNRILFARHYDHRAGEKSYLFVEFLQGTSVEGRQKIRIGKLINNMGEGYKTTLLRNSDCTDMAFFAYHFHNLFRELYPRDEYNSWD